MTSCLLPWITKRMQNGVCSERKEFAPKGANSFILELTSIGNGSKTEIGSIPSPEMYLFILRFGQAVLTRARGYKTFFMLNSTEHEIFPAHKC